MSDEPEERLGIVLDDVYDGISVWIEPDGTATNRWGEFDPDNRRWRLTQNWIDAYNMGRESKEAQ